MTNYTMCNKYSRKIKYRTYYDTTYSTFSHQYSLLSSLTVEPISMSAIGGFAFLLKNAATKSKTLTTTHPIVTKMLPIIKIMKYDTCCKP